MADLKATAVVAAAAYPSRGTTSAGASATAASHRVGTIEGASLSFSFRLTLEEAACASVSASVCVCIAPAVTRTLAASRRATSPRFLRWYKIRPTMTIVQNVK